MIWKSKKLMSVIVFLFIFLFGEFICCNNLPFGEEVEMKKRVSYCDTTFEENHFVDPYCSVTNKTITVSSDGVIFTYDEENGFNACFEDRPFCFQIKTPEVGFNNDGYISYVSGCEEFCATINVRKYTR